MQIRRPHWGSGSGHGTILPLPLLLPVPELVQTFQKMNCRIGRRRRKRGWLPSNPLRTTRRLGARPRRVLTRRVGGFGPSSGSCRPSQRMEYHVRSPCLSNMPIAIANVFSMVDQPTRRSSRMLGQPTISSMRLLIWRMNGSRNVKDHFLICPSKPRTKSLRRDN